MTLLPKSLDVKHTRLRDLIQPMESVVVAFSGGVDSTLLLKLCLDTLGREGVLAVTAGSEMIPQLELDDARAMADALSVRHKVIGPESLNLDAIRNNPTDRCYHCKKEVFGKIMALGREMGFQEILDGTNYDDGNTYRPGMQAARELGVRSPLQEAGLTKQDIRDLSRRYELPTWDKPALACLATRIPYGEALTPEKLQRIDQGETRLRKWGFTQVRLRCHGDLARIEVLPEEFHLALDQRDKMVDDLSDLGFKHVTLDLAGYRSGSMDQK